VGFIRDDFKGTGRTGDKGTREQGDRDRGLHFVEVFETAGAEEHEGKEHEVVRGVDDGAGGEGAGGEANPAEDKADKDEKEKGAEGPGGLETVHEREWEAGN